MESIYEANQDRESDIYPDLPPLAGHDHEASRPESPVSSVTIVNGGESGRIEKMVEGLVPKPSQESTKPLPGYERYEVEIQHQNIFNTEMTYLLDKDGETKEYSLRNKFRRS